MSYKRITRFRLVASRRPRKKYEKIYFIDIFLRSMADPETMVIIIDESGFGTTPLQKYGYAPVGQPITHYWKKMNHNLTLCAAISKTGLEAV